MAAAVELGPNCQLLLDDVEDLVDHQANQKTVVLTHDHLNRVRVGLVVEGLQRSVQAQQRDDLTAILHHVVAADALEPVHHDLLKTVDRAAGQRDPSPVGATQGKEGWSLDSRVSSDRTLGVGGGGGG